MKRKTTYFIPNKRCKVAQRAYDEAIQKAYDKAQRKAQAKPDPLPNSIMKHLAF